MSIYSTLMCPNCKKGFLGLSTAYGWNRLRFDCSDDCGYDQQIYITNLQVEVLKKIMNKRIIKK